MVDFQPLSFSAFAPALQNIRDNADKEQTQQLISAALGGAMPGQPGQPAAGGQSGAPNVNPGLIQAAQANPAIIGQLLSSKNPQAQQVGMFLLDRAQPKPKTYGFQTAADGTVLRTDPNTGGVAPVYQAPKPKHVIQTPDGTVLAVDPISGEATPTYQGGPKQAPVPAGYRATPTGAVEPIPGGPEDLPAQTARLSEQAVNLGMQPGSREFKQYIASGGKYVPPKPLPPGALSQQNEDLDAINAATAINSSLTDAKAQLESGKLELGPMVNFMSKAQNAAGMSSDNSRNYASFLATLEKIRNDSLRLNKGVQTEGDAQRAWNELFNNINDPKLVQQRIGEITQLNQKAIEYRKARINQTRAEYGADPLDVGNIILGGAGQKDQSQAPQGPRTSTQAQPATTIPDGATATNPTTGQKIIFRNGQWGPM